jgi:hypothetical protein
MSRDARIDDYIASLPPFSQQICFALRELIHAVDSKIEEAWKWGPNFSHQGMVCGFGAFSSWVTLTFFKGALMKDRDKLFNYGFKNAHNRSIKFKDVEQIPKQKLKAYLKEAVRLNLDEVKVSVPYRRTGPSELPEKLRAILQSKDLLNRFRERPPYQKRDYVQWTTSPAREETKARRFKILLEDLKTGRFMNMAYRPTKK